MTHATPPHSLHGLTPAIVREARKPDLTLWAWAGISMPTESVCEPDVSMSCMDARANVPCERDVFCTVLTRTRQVGWPHGITTPERVEIASVVLHRYARGRSAVGCVWPFGTPARAFCTVVRRARPSVVRVRVKVWEDGSYRLTRV